MTFALALHELWSRKRLLALGAIVATLAALATVSNVSLLPPKIEGGTLDVYSGRTQILVDSEQSTIADLKQDLQPMIARANVFSRLLTTPTALRFIGDRAGIPATEIYAEGPFQLNKPRFVQEPTAERRGNQIAGRKARYRLRFESDPELPIVVIYAEAPSQGKAAALADGAASGLARYVQRLQDNQNIPVRQRVEVRQLGSTSASSVSDGASTKVAGFVFFVTFGIWCIAILGARRLVDGWRDANARPEPVDDEPLAAEPPSLEDLLLGDGAEVGKARSGHAGKTRVS